MPTRLYKQDTIAAISSNPSGAALTIIRVSGPDSKKIFSRMTGEKNIKSRYAYFSLLRSNIDSKTILDSSIIIFYQCPKSYTGEDSLEIICHGGTVVANTIIEDLVASGLRMADAGEFTLRAYLNNKLDLLSAASIDALIKSKSKNESRIHLRNISKGSAFNSITKIKKTITNIVTILENELNFSEEEVDHLSMNNIKTSLEKIKSTIISIIKHTAYGKETFNGKRVVIVGRPNVGKSTLFNNLVGTNRAITSKKAGTTRDTIEAWFEINNLPVCLVDTAGIWETADTIEEEGIKRSLEEIKTADIIVVLDDIDPSSFAESIIDKYGVPSKKIIKVRTKSDLAKKNSSKYINISYINNKGNKKLINKLSTMLSTAGLDVGSFFHITSVQVSILKRGVDILADILRNVESGATMDIVSSQLRDFIDAVERVSGEVHDETVIKNIFESFCVGK